MNLPTHLAGLAALAVRRVARLDEYWRGEYEERAAIMEYDGGLPRQEAELAAYMDIWRRMRREQAR